MDTTEKKVRRTDLRVPWISQLGPDVEGSGDCGQACILMLLYYYGIIEPTSPITVEHLCEIKSGKTSAADLVRLAAKFDLELITALVGYVSDLRQYLYDERPVILLVNYNDLDFPVHLASGANQGWHWLLVVGYEGEDFVVHDPLWLPSQRMGRGGGSITIPGNTLRAALVTTAGWNAVV